MRKAINLLVLVIILAFISCQDDQNSSEISIASYENSDEMVAAAKKIITEINIENFKTLFDGDDYFIIIDVRTEDEYEAGYIPGAVSIPRGLLEFRIGKEDVWDEMGLYIPEKTDNIIVNCRTGGRSALAAKSLMELGYENVKSLEGGFNAWKEKYPELVEKITSDEEYYYETAPAKAQAAGGC